MFFGMNDGKTWVKERGHYWFKCPRCGEQYRPGSGKKDAVAANFVLSITNPENGQLELIPTSWPPSEDDRWLHNAVEIQARQIQTQQDLDAWYNKSKLDLSELTNRQKISVHFQQLEFHTKPGSGALL